MLWSIFWSSKSPWTTWKLLKRWPANTAISVPVSTTWGLTLVGFLDGKTGHANVNLLFLNSTRSSLMPLEHDDGESTRTIASLLIYRNPDPFNHSEFLFHDLLDFRFSNVHRKSFDSYGFRIDHLLLTFHSFFFLQFPLNSLHVKCLLHWSCRLRGFLFLIHCRLFEVVNLLLEFVKLNITYLDCSFLHGFSVLGTKILIVHFDLIVGMPDIVPPQDGNVCVSPQVIISFASPKHAESWNLLLPLEIPLCDWTFPLQDFAFENFLIGRAVHFEFDTWHVLFCVIDLCRFTFLQVQLVFPDFKSVVVSDLCFAHFYK